MKVKRSSKTWLIGVIVVTLGLVGATVYVLKSQQDEAAKNSNAGANVDSKTDAANQIPTATGERFALTYTDDGFTPRDFTVARGTIIIISNNSSRDVQFSSNDHPEHKGNTLMNLKVLSPGKSTSYPANQTGLWGFHDHLDSSKTGAVTVTE